MSGVRPDVTRPRDDTDAQAGGRGAAASIASRRAAGSSFPSTSSSPLPASTSPPQLPTAMEPRTKSGRIVKPSWRICESESYSHLGEDYQQPSPARSTSSQPGRSTAGTKPPIVKVRPGARPPALGEGGCLGTRRADAEHPCPRSAFPAGPRALAAQANVVGRTLQAVAALAVPQLDHPDAARLGRLVVVATGDAEAASGRPAGDLQLDAKDPAAHRTRADASVPAEPAQARPSSRRGRAAAAAAASVVAKGRRSARLSTSTTARMSSASS